MLDLNNTLLLLVVLFLLGRIHAYCGWTNRGLMELKVQLEEIKAQAEQELEAPKRTMWDD